MMEWTFSI